MILTILLCYYHYYEATVLKELLKKLYCHCMFLLNQQTCHYDVILMLQDLEELDFT